MPELITDYQETTQGANWSKLAVGFEELIGTIAHELAHAYQFLTNEDEVKSQCESSGARDKEGDLLYPQLAYEQTALTNEIKTMTVKLPEYQKLKNWWEGKELAKNLLEDKLDNQDKSWPQWVLPVGIILGVLLLLGIIYKLFKKKPIKTSYMSKQILSEPQPCSKCQKKYGPDLTDWTPCNNCTWTTKETPKTPASQKQCSVCAKSLNFLEPEPDQYLCSKKACMWHYLSNKEK